MPFCINLSYKPWSKHGNPCQGQKPSPAKQFINISTARSSHSQNRQPHKRISLPSRLSRFKKHKCCQGFLGVLGVCPTLWLVSAHHHLPQLRLLILSTNWTEGWIFPGGNTTSFTFVFRTLTKLLFSSLSSSSIFLTAFLFILFSFLSVVCTFSSFIQISLKEQPFF